MTKTLRNTILYVAAVCAILAISFGPMASVARACSEVQFSDGPDIVISGRTMDFEVDLASEIMVVPRGQQITSMAPDGAQGISWTSKYGFVGVNALGLDKYCDGLNEKGLSIATLWLAESEYPIPAESGSALSIQDTPAWVLGNFATVEEVKAALQDVTIWGEWSDELQMVPPFHLAIHDALGNNLVVEFLNGQMYLYDNPYGVLTNSPTFEWQMTNLNYYFSSNKLQVTPDSQGETSDPGIAMMGVPGIQNPPQRLVLLAILRSYLTPPQDPLEAVQFAFHLMDRVTLVPGEDRITPSSATAMPTAMPFGGDYTQWTVVRDHVNMVYYYKTVLNSSVRTIDMKEIDLSEGQPIHTIPMEEDGALNFQDVTSQLEPK